MPNPCHHRPRSSAWRTVSPAEIAAVDAASYPLRRNQERKHVGADEQCSPAPAKRRQRHLLPNKTGRRCRTWAVDGSSGPQIALRGASDETPQRSKRQSAPHQPDRPRFRTWAPLHKVLQSVVASRPQNSIPRGIAKIKSKTQSLNLRSAIPGVRQATIVLGVAALLVTLGIVLEAPTHPTLTIRHAQLGPSAPEISPGHLSTGTSPHGVSIRTGKKTPARQRPNPQSQLAPNRRTPGSKKGDFLNECQRESNLAGIPSLGLIPALQRDDSVHPAACHLHPADDRAHLNH